MTVLREAVAAMERVAAENMMIVDSCREEGGGICVRLLRIHKICAQKKTSSIATSTTTFFSTHSIAIHETTTTSVILYR